MPYFKQGSLWIDISPETAIFTGQNLNKLKDRTGKDQSLSCAADGARSDLDSWSFSPSLPESVAWMSPCGKGKCEKLRSSVCHIMNVF